MSAASNTLHTLSPQSNRVVLIIEDDVPIAEALALIVEDLGYTPLIATDGLTGLTLARSNNPVLIFTDLMLPKLTGQQVIAQFRAEQAAQGTAATPIVIVTAAGRHHAREAGGDAFILKPFEIETVETTLQRLLAVEGE